MRATLARRGRHLLTCQTTRAISSGRWYAAAAPIRRRSLPRPLACRTFRRTFLNGIFQKPPREVRPPEYEPGWMQIMVWRSRMMGQLRPPPRQELLDAWRRLMDFKLRYRVPMNATQALQCRRLLRWLDGPSADGDYQRFTADDLYRARRVLLDIKPYERTQIHREFAKALHEVWGSGTFTGGDMRSRAFKWKFLIKSLCEFSGAREAANLLLEKWDDPEYAIYIRGKEQLFKAVAKALAREGREIELTQLIHHAESQGIPYESEIQAIMVNFFAQRRNRVAETQHWLSKSDKPLPETYRIVASFASREKLQSWATALFLKLGESQPSKEYWDVILQAILLSGKSLKEVDTLMSHMVDQSGEVSPDVETINGLLGVAAETRDARLGDDILALAAERGIAPDGSTHLVLLELRLLTGELVAAQRAYEEVKYLEPWTEKPKLDLYAHYQRLVNQYLVALCAQSPMDFKHISSILEAVEEGHMRLDPATVATLCLRFLENDQHFEVMDLLAIYSFLYSEAEREVIQNAFVSFCLNERTSTSRAWGAYQLLYQFFQDTSPEKREELMEGFFARGRPDMASQVFGHMRAHQNNSYHPKLDTYIRCLEGFAQHPDLEGLDMVHNMLKMDVNVQFTTKLYTALMLAYTACGRPLLAMDFWHEITQSREGPSYASLEAVFWTLEKKPGGHVKARDLWDRIERMDLELTPGVYNAYIGAIAGGGNEKETKSLIINMAGFIGSPPDAMTLGIAYNALPSREDQKEFEDWAQSRYGSAWAALLKKGRQLNEFSLCQFRIKRALKS